LARPPSVLVGSLSADEAAQLRRISRQSKVFALRQRAQIILASDSEVAAPQIALVRACLRRYEGVWSGRKTDPIGSQSIRRPVALSAGDIGEPASSSTIFSSAFRCRVRRPSGWVASPTLLTLRWTGPDGRASSSLGRTSPGRVSPSTRQRPGEACPSSDGMTERLPRSR
jgi:hypothetical protein